MRGYGPPDLRPGTRTAGPLPKGFRPSGKGKKSIAGKPEISTGHPTKSPLKDEQPRRAASPIPGTYTHTPGA